VTAGDHVNEPAPGANRPPRRRLLEQGSRIRSLPTEPREAGFLQFACSAVAGKRGIVEIDG
jgi:hypothetical protein